MKNMPSFENQEKAPRPTPAEKYEAEHTWEALRGQLIADTLKLLRLAVLPPEETLASLVSAYQKMPYKNIQKEEKSESFETRAIQNLELLVAEKILRPEMTVRETMRLLERHAGTKAKNEKNSGVIEQLDREHREKLENEPDLNLDPDVVYRRLDNTPEAFKDDAMVAKKIEKMEEESLGKNALRWELENSALGQLEKTKFMNPAITLSQVLIVLEGRMKREEETGESPSGKLLQKIEDLIEAHVLKRSMTIPSAIAFLKEEVKKEPKLKKQKSSKVS